MTDWTYAKLEDAHSHWRQREIWRIVFPDDTYLCAKTHSKVLVIEPYSEPGEMAWTIWFEVLFSDGGKIRVNGSHVASVHFNERMNING